MRRVIQLPYGSRPLPVQLGDWATVPELPSAGSVEPVRDVIDAALDAPIGSERLENLVSRGDRVTLIVSDATRDEPRSALVASVRRRLPDGTRLTIAIANGTHAPGPPESLGICAELWRGANVVNHDAQDDAALVAIGTTLRGTSVRVNRCLTECDLVVATGRITPHYFAGFGAGAKAMFPGLGGNAEIRQNHLLKAEPGAALGVVDGNPCREDLEEVVGLLGRRSVLVNVVADATGAARGAVAGDVLAAFRAGAELCRALVTVRARSARTIVVSGAGPVTASLYQASKLVATAAPLLKPGGAIVLAAECAAGTGPLDTVNRGIYELGIRPLLPADHRIYLVSALPAGVVASTYCTYLERVEDVVSEATPALVLARAGAIIPTT